MMGLRKMKKILLIIGMLGLMVLIGCVSSVPYCDKVEFCESKGLVYDGSQDDGYFNCKVIDENYLVQKILIEIEKENLKAECNVNYEDE